MPQITNNNSFKLLALFSTLLLLNGCVTQPEKVSDTSLNPIEETAQTEQPEESNIESIHYINRQQGSEALREPLEPLIPDVADVEQSQLTPPTTPDEAIVEQAPAATEPTDLWHRLRQNYGLPDNDHPGVKADQAWYAKHPGYLLRVTERAHPYLHFILEEVEARGMPSEIALLPIVESAFLPFAYSHGRAAGIWQFIPSTGEYFGLKQNWWYDGRRDVYASTKAALTYLQRLHKTFDGDWLLALAAYNSGSGTVSRAIRKNKSRGKPTDYWNLDLPKETKGYVPKLLALSNLVAKPETFNVKFTPIPDEHYFEKVETGGQIDLALAAELAELSTDHLYNLNPGFNRWATDPDGPHYLLLPKENAETFTQALAQLPENRRVKWVRHVIQPGESLLLIAKKYQTSVDLLKESNKISGSMIRAGKHLLVPTATRSLNSYRQTAESRKKTIQQRKRDGHKITHTVKGGDTLWDLSRKHKVGVKELAKWNAMAPRDPLKPGQQLVIWSSKPPLTKQFNNGPSTPLQNIKYRVRQGDSLSRIAQKFSVTVADLKRWNSLNTQKYLQPGQRITLYVDVTRQSGS